MQGCWRGCGASGLQADEFGLHGQEAAFSLGCEGLPDGPFFGLGASAFFGLLGGLMGGLGGGLGRKLFGAEPLQLPPQGRRRVGWGAGWLEGATAESAVAKGAVKPDGQLASHLQAGES